MNMLKSVINFMNQEDKNGEWFEFYNEYQNGEVDFDYVVDYLHETLFVWMEDGLELTPRIDGYVDYLEG